jgi:hypothetical protein
MQDFTFPRVGQGSKNQRENSQRAFLKLLYSCCPPFWAVWSTLPGWLKHLPALPILLLKFSSTRNFWFVGPKIMKFVLPPSLLQGACSQKVSKNPKLKWYQVTLPKSGLGTPCTYGPLGVNVPTFMLMRHLDLIEKGISLPISQKPFLCLCIMCRCGCIQSFRTRIHVSSWFVLQRKHKLLAYRFGKNIFSSIAHVLLIS